MYVCYVGYNVFYPSLLLATFSVSFVSSIEDIYVFARISHIKHAALLGTVVPLRR